MIRIAIDIGGTFTAGSGVGSSSTSSKSSLSRSRCRSKSMRTSSSGVPLYIGCMWLTELCTISMVQSLPTRSTRWRCSSAVSKVPWMMLSAGAMRVRSEK